MHKYPIYKGKKTVDAQQMKIAIKLTGPIVSSAKKSHKGSKMCEK